MKNNCLNCALFTTCNYPSKSADYVCESYKPFSAEEIGLFDFDYDENVDENNTLPVTDESILIDNTRLNSAFGSMEKNLEEALADNLPVPRDFKFDDRDIPLAKNMYDFITNKSYGFQSSELFSRQLWIATKLFGEWCEPCTREKHKTRHGKSRKPMRDILNVKIGWSMHEFADKVQLLEHGVCPKCKRTRLDLYKSKHLKYYTELGISAGQRCVVGDTLVLTGNGLQRIGSFLTDDMKQGFNSFNVEVCNAKDGLETTSDFYISKKENTLKIRTRHGYILEGTHDHPVYLIDKFKTLKTVEIGDYIKIKYNTNIYGNKVTTYENKRLTENIAFVLGVWVAEGNAFYISNIDKKLLKKCRENLSEIAHKNSISYVRNRGTLVGIRINKRTMELLEKLGLDSSLKSATKVVPDSILQASKSIQCRFLQGYFEGDGTVEKRTVSCTSLSKKLIFDIQAMLLNIGIVSRIRQRKTWASNGSDLQVEKNAYELSIEGNTFLKIYKKEIGFFSTRKKLKLNNLIKSNARRKLKMPYYYDKLPSEVKVAFLDFIEGLDYFNIFPPPLYKDTVTRNKNSSFGKCSVLGSRFGHRDDTKNPMYLYDTWKRLCSPNVCLTRRKANTFFTVLDTYKEFFNKEQVYKYAYLKDVINEPDCFFSDIIDIKVSKKTKVTYDFTLPRTHQFWSNGFISHNSGKSILTSFLFAYHTQRILKMQKPAELLTGAANTLLTLSMVSIDKGGVMRNLWLPFYAALEDSKFFREYHSMLDHYGKRFGEEPYKKMDTFLHYKHRKFFLHPTVPNQRSLRGATRCGSSIDELGWLDAHSPDKVTLSADGIYEALNRSMLTVRNAARKLFKSGYYDIPTGLSINISSPSSQDDKIMQIVTKHSHSKTVLTVHQPTWNLNPHVGRNDPEIEKAYAEDPIAADRDYGANPPAKGGKTFFYGAAQVYDAFRASPKNRVEYVYETKESSKEEGKIYKAAIPKMFPPSNVTGAVLAIDAGVTDNSFAIVVGHWENYDKKDTQKYIQFDVLVEVIPNRGANTLHHSRINKNIIEPLIKAFNVKYIVADRWNSLYMLHRYSDDFPQIICAEQYSVKYKDFVAFRSYLENGAIKFPQLETHDEALYVHGIASEGKYYPNCFDYMPAAHLFYQLMTVQDTGKTVDKAHKKTDDLFRAAVLAFSYLTDEDVQPHLANKIVNTNRGIVALAGGGGALKNVIINNRGKGIAAM